MKLETTAAKQRSQVQRHWLNKPRLRIRTSERKIFLFLVDVLIINLALAIPWLLATEEGRSLATIVSPYKWYITLTIVWCVSAFIFDVYNLARSASTTNIVRNIGLAALTTVLVYTLIPWLTPPLQSRTLVFAFAGLVLGGLVSWRVIYAQLFVQPQFRQRALVIGAGWAGRTLVESLGNVTHDANPFRGTGYELVGFIDDNPELTGGQVVGVWRDQECQCTGDPEQRAEPEAGTDQP